MPTTLIASNPDFKRSRPLLAPGISDLASNLYLDVAELFCDTIQGEGISTGVPSTFLRLKGCTLDCVWCDTQSVWKFGNPYSFEEIFDLMDTVDLPKRFKQGQHLIITGGSPLKQQVRVTLFIHFFIQRYGFKPFIEIENECVLTPTEDLIILVDQWNNSPKLSNSGMKAKARYKPELLSYMASLNNSWFKFVIGASEDWDEILIDFLDSTKIRKDQIILMPCGEDQEELSITREPVADLAVKHGVRFCDRLHITIWNKKTGV